MSRSDLVALTSVVTLVLAALVVAVTHEGPRAYYLFSIFDVRPCDGSGRPLLALAWLVAVAYAGPRFLQADCPSSRSEVAQALLVGALCAGPFCFLPDLPVPRHAVVPALYWPLSAWATASVGAFAARAWVRRWLGAAEPESPLAGPAAPPACPARLATRHPPVV